GVLNVSATHVPSGKQARVRIADSPYRLTRQQRRVAQKRLRELTTTDPDSPDTHSVDDSELVLARALAERAATVLAQKDQSAEPTNVERVRQAHQALSVALAGSAEDAALAEL